MVMYDLNLLRKENVTEKRNPQKAIRINGAQCHFFKRQIIHFELIIQIFDPLMVFVTSRNDDNLGLSLNHGIMYMTALLQQRLAD